MLDSSATIQPGFVWGNNYWLGSISGCAAVRNPMPLTLSSRFPRNMKSTLIKAIAPFDVDYRMVYAKHQSPWQIQVEFLLSDKILHIGMCLPASCSDSEISNLTQSYLDGNFLESQNVFEHQPEVVLVKDLYVKSDFLQKTSVKIIGYTFDLVLILI